MKKKLIFLFKSQYSTKRCTAKDTCFESFAGKVLDFWPVLEGSTVVPRECFRKVVTITLVTNPKSFTAVLLGGWHVSRRNRVACQWLDMREFCVLVNVGNVV